jgi:hypothetical protein
MDLFRRYLLVGGMPDAVTSYLEEHNIHRVREIQNEIREYYAADASKYDEERRLKIRGIYDMIPSNMENKKKRVIAQEIENKKGRRFTDYQDEFEYLMDDFDVKLVVNPDYSVKNNLHSMALVAGLPGNTYIVPCDIWCEENPFRKNEFLSWYMMTEEPDPDSGLRINRKQEVIWSADEGSRAVGIAYLLEKDWKISTTDRSSMPSPTPFKPSQME